MSLIEKKFKFKEGEKFSHNLTEAEVIKREGSLMLIFRNDRNFELGRVYVDKDGDERYHEPAVVNCIVKEADNWRSMIKAEAIKHFELNVHKDEEFARKQKTLEDARIKRQEMSQKFTNLQAQADIEYRKLRREIKETMQEADSAKDVLSSKKIQKLAVEAYTCFLMTKTSAFGGF